MSGVNSKYLYKISRQRIARLASALVLLLLFLQVIMPFARAEPVPISHHIVLIQGDDPKTPEVESENEIYVVERFTFWIPWNESFVEVAVPKEINSERADFDHVIYVDPMGYIPGMYSAYWNSTTTPYKEFISMENMDCCISNRYVWGFPSGSERNHSASSLLDTPLDFEQYVDEDRSDDVWNYSDSGMRMKPGNAFGDYLSQSSELGVNITKVKMSWVVLENEENITLFASNDNGAHWLNMTGKEGQQLFFTTSGSDFVLKFNMTQDVKRNNTPLLSELGINLTYTPDYNEIILQLYYIVERDPSSDEFDFTLDLHEDSDYGIAPYIIVYINEGYSVKSDQTPLTLYEEQTEYPGKNSYVFMGGSYSPEAIITIQKDEGKGQIPWELLLVIIILLVCIGIVIATRSKKEPKDTSKPVTKVSNEKKKLLERKQNLLKAIKKLDKDFEAGILDEEVYRELRADYKRKTVDIMKELDQYNN